MILIASTWIQAFTGTNFDFSSYSSDMKSVLEISQVQLNYLSMASDFGKAFGWCSGVSLMYFPLWVVLLIAAFMGLVGYGLQWLVIQRIIFLPYFLVSFFFSPSPLFSWFEMKFWELNPVFAVPCLFIACFFPCKNFFSLDYLVDCWQWWLTVVGATARN